MKRILPILLLFFATQAWGQLELPIRSADDLIFRNPKGRFTFKYLPDCKVSHWVAYKLTATDLVVTTERSDRFSVDKSLVSIGLPVAKPVDYTKSGYDRGHMLPSADRLCNPEANQATFLMSNIAPQLPAVNRGTWKTLEEQVRRWATTFDTLYIVCGSIIPCKHTTIGNGVAVPSHFFKAILLRKGDAQQIKCYIMPNNALINKQISTYSVPLDALEKAAEIDLIWNNQPN